MLASRKAPPKAATVRVAWMPHPGPQTAFLACPVREILYGGAKGGGKTDAIGPKALKHVQQYGQWATVLILRETFQQLTEIMERMRPLCRALSGAYNKTEKTWRFPSGARIIFGHLGKGCDPYWGQEYSLIIVDEVTRTLPDEADYLKLLGSLRNSHGVPCQVILTSNPGGKGHAWVKQRFMMMPPLTVFTDPKTGLQRVYIPASLRDNPSLPPEYRLQLEQMSEKERRAFLEGDWSAFEGTVFNIEPGIHSWTWAQFKERTGEDSIPASWLRFRVMDWGYARPFAIHWIAVAPGGRAFVYREWYGVATDANGKFQPNVGVQMAPEDVAERVARIEREAGETIAAGWTGPDLFNKGRGDYGASKAPNEHFQAHGVHWLAWNASDRVAGKLALHHRMRYTRDEGEAITEWPGLIWITEECPHALRTIPALEYDKLVPEDVDSTGEDHVYDADKGFCVMRTWEPPPPPKAKGWRDRLHDDEATDWMVN